MHRSIRLLTAGAALASIGLGVGTARAEILGSGSFEWHDEGGFEECGLNNLFFVQDGSAHYVSRIGTGSQTGLFPGHANFDIDTVVTNLDNGKWFTIKEDFSDHQLPATNVGGTIWEGKRAVVGTVTVRNSEGRVVIRDAGRETWVERFDDRGDNAPGTDFLAEISHRYVGHHPLYDMTEQEFCAAEVALLG